MDYKKCLKIVAKVLDKVKHCNLNSKGEREMKLMDLICEVLNEGKKDNEPKWTACEHEPVRICNNGAYKNINTGKFVSKVNSENED